MQRCKDLIYYMLGQKSTLTTEFLPGTIKQGVDNLEYIFGQFQAILKTVNINILSTPLTNHKAIKMNISLLPSSTTYHQNSYWKLNNSVLCHEAEGLRNKNKYFGKRTKLKEYMGVNWNFFSLETTVLILIKTKTNSVSLKLKGLY